jgi:hypothetical protein
MPGDYQRYLRLYSNLLTNLALGPVQTFYPSAITVKKSVYQIWLQSMNLVVTNYVAGTIQVVGDVSGTVYGEFNIPAVAPAAGASAQYFIDYGPEGWAAQLGENIDIDGVPDGFTGLLHIDAYQRLGQTVCAPSGGNSTLTGTVLLTE